MRYRIRTRRAGADAKRGEGAVSTGMLAERFFDPATAARRRTLAPEDRDDEQLRALGDNTNDKRYRQPKRDAEAADEERPAVRCFQHRRPRVYARPTVNTQRRGVRHRAKKKVSGSAQRARLFLGGGGRGGGSLRVNALERGPLREGCLAHAPAQPCTHHLDRLRLRICPLRRCESTPARPRSAKSPRLGPSE